jgi:hypothetical protein
MCGVVGLQHKPHGTCLMHAKLLGTCPAELSKLCFEDCSRAVTQLDDGGSMLCVQIGQVAASCRAAACYVVSVERCLLCLICVTP